MPFPALKPSCTVRAASEREALPLAYARIREDLVEYYGEEARDLPLEPFLVLEMEPGVWDVMVDTPLASPLIPAVEDISF